MVDASLLPRVHDTSECFLGTLFKTGSFKIKHALKAAWRNRGKPILFICLWNHSFLSLLTEAAPWAFLELINEMDLAPIRCLHEVMVNPFKGDFKVMAETLNTWSKHITGCYETYLSSPRWNSRCSCTLFGLSAWFLFTSCERRSYCLVTCVCVTYARLSHMF